MTDLGCVPLLVKLLGDPSQALQALSATTIANVARIKKARKIVRKCNGLPKLVCFLIYKSSQMKSKIKNKI